METIMNWTAQEDVG